MQSTVQRIFKLNLMIMKLLGFYPTEKFKKLYALYSYAVYFCCTVPVPTLAAVHLIVGEKLNLAQLVDSLVIIFQVGCFIFKLIPFVFNVNNVRKTIHMLDWPIFNNYNCDQETIVEECVIVCKQNTWLFLGFCICSMCTWGLTPFFGSIHKFPIEIWLPFDATADTKTYTLIYLFIIIGVGNGAIANGVIDPLVSGLACFAATQLRILKNNLEFLSTTADNEIECFSENLNHNERIKLKNLIIYNKIKNCIKHHSAILKFVEEYEKVYSSIAFTQFMASVLVVCISCYQLSTVEPFTFVFFGLVSFLTTMLIEIFLYSYFGTSLYEESNSLTSAAYKGAWYDYDMKSKKALLILMERSKKPIVVSAGKILDLSLDTFTTVLRRAYSLLAVLRNY